MSLFRIFIVFFLILASGVGQAKVYRPYIRPGVQAHDYNSVVPLLQGGDVLEFTNGAKYYVERILGHGGTTLILEATRLENGDIVALRIPLFKGEYSKTLGLSAFAKRRTLLKQVPLPQAKKELTTQDNILVGNDHTVPYQKFLSEATKTYKILQDQNFPMPKVLDAHEGEYLATEAIRPLENKVEPTRLSDLLIRPRSFTENQIVEMKNALVILAQQLAHIGKFYDFAADQVLYNPSTKTWQVVDFIYPPKNVFGFFKMPPIEKGILYSAIDSVRSQMNRNTKFIDEILELVLETQRAQMAKHKANKRFCTIFERIF